MEIKEYFFPQYGIGLFNCAKILEAHNNTIWIESAAIQFDISNDLVF